MGTHDDLEKRSEQREARRLAKLMGMKYTAALRQVREEKEEKNADSRSS